MHFSAAAFVIALGILLTHANSAAGPAPTPRLAAADGTSSTPGALTLPQLGTIGFRCGRAFAVQPFFDTRGSPTEDSVTLRSGRLTRRYRLVTLGSTVSLPFAHYRTVVVTVRQGTEARAITAKATVTFVDGRFHRLGVRGLLGACYVARWNVVMNVSPF